MKMQRNHGLDLLRMVSMLMVAVLHVLGQGGVLARTGSNDVTYYVCYFLEAACLCAVNCYGLISGYVGSRSTFKARKLISMILTVEFYSLLIGLILGLTHRDWLDRDVLLQIMLPVQWKTWWYYSAYVGLYLLTPFLNRGVNALENREKKNLMAVCFMVFSVFPMAAKSFSVDFFSLIGGYSLIWLIVLYVFGACLRGIEEEAEDGAKNGFWEGILKLNIPVLAGIFLLSTALAWLWKLLVEIHLIRVPAETAFNRMLLIYHSPTLLINGLALVLLFRQLTIRPGRLRQVIGLLAPSAFYVYIIHAHPLIWEHILKGCFQSWKDLHPALVIFPVIGTALLIYLGCSGIDVGRRKILETFRKIIRRDHAPSGE